METWGRRNHSNSIFKIDDIVIFNGKQHKILAMNYVDVEDGVDIFEYVVDNYDWLVWDSELTLVVKKIKWGKGKARLGKEESGV